MRRVVALLLILIGGAGCTIGSSAEPMPEPSPSVAVSSFEPVADMVAKYGDDRIEAVDDSRLPVSMGGRVARTALLAFARPDFPARCVEEAQLRLRLDSGHPSAPVSISVYPSRIVDATDLNEGAQLQDPGHLLDNRPKDEVEVDDEPGWVAFDVRDIYKLWLKGGPFPSQNKRVPKDSPVVFAVRATTGEHTFVRNFMSAESESPPKLVVTTRSSCS